MLRKTAAFIFDAVILLAMPAGSAAGQAWNDARSLDLVRGATERRARQIADTALVDYSATAHGYLTFLAQVGEGFREPPKIVKADELALEVYWRAPNLSKQRIVGRRDTLLLPTDINYHRDHLGIVQNNFPSIIRLGDGDEVRDVPHPLSDSGLAEYDFAIRDSLQIRLGPRTLDVYEVRVRPKNERAPRAVGAVYISRESGEVVRMAFSFTRAALKDRQLDDVSVVLENALHEGRFWLPHRQEIEIRRSGTWMDYPARGIIRGRWEICCYEVNRGVPLAVFGGPEIVVAPRGTQQKVPFTGQILDSLPPDVRAVTPAEVARVQEEARELVRAQALARSRTFALAARRISDFARVNRVEGFALGAGFSQRLGEGFALGARARYGFADDKLKGAAALSYSRASGAGGSLAYFDDFHEAGDVQEVSLARNSLASQEFGSDYTDPFAARGASLTLRSRAFASWQPSLELALERTDPLSVNARPATGSYEPTVAAWSARERRVTLTVDRPTRLTRFGIESQVRFAASAIRYERTEFPAERDIQRVALDLQLERPFPRVRLMTRSVVAGVFGSALIPPQHLVFFGGPVSGPGYAYHEFAGRAGYSQRLELRTPVPFPSLSLGRYGRTPGALTLAPFAHVVWINDRSIVRFRERGGDPMLPRPVNDAPAPLPAGWFPSIGLGALSIFDLLRVDVARGLRNGRWTFSVDVAREFWPVL